MRPLKTFLFESARSVENWFSRPLPSPESARNFLLLAYPTALGTAIHSTPLLAALHECVPERRIAVAASGFSAALLKNDPRIENLLVTPNPLQDLRGAVRALRSVRWFDGEPFVTLLPAGNERTRILLAAVLGGLHQRIGFAVHPELLQSALAYDSAQSVIANNLRLLEALRKGECLKLATQQSPELVEPQVYPAPQDFAKAKEVLSAEGIDPERPLAIFVTQTSVTQRKSWRAERFVAVASMLHERYGMQIVFVGTSGEAKKIDSLREAIGFPTASVAGRTSLLEASALMAMSDVGVSLDTGPLHLARAMKLPTVIIAPAWSPVFEWLPISSPRARIIKNADLPSAPEDYIIDEVSVEDVENALHDLLSIYPPLQDRARRLAALQRTAS